MKSQMSLKPGQIGSFVIELHPLEKAYILLYHQHSLFSFDWIILKLADKVDMDKVLDKCEKSLETYTV